MIWGKPSKRRNAVATASASWVPSPSPHGPESLRARSSYRRGQVEGAREKGEILSGAFDLHSSPRALTRGGASSGSTGGRLRAQTSEAAAKSAIHIEKSEVKTGGRRHHDAVEHDPSFQERLPPTGGSRSRFSARSSKSRGLSKDGRAAGKEIPLSSNMI